MSNGSDQRKEYVNKLVKALNSLGSIQVVEDVSVPEVGPNPNYTEVFIRVRPDALEIWNAQWIQIVKKGNESPLLRNNFETGERLIYLPERDRGRSNGVVKGTYVRVYGSDDIIREFTNVIESVRHTRIDPTGFKTTKVHVGGTEDQTDLVTVEPFKRSTPIVEGGGMRRGR